MSTVIVGDARAHAITTHMVRAYRKSERTSRREGNATKKCVVLYVYVSEREGEEASVINHHSSISLSLFLLFIIISHVH